MRCYIDYNSLACLSTSEPENAITPQDTKEDTDDVKMTSETDIVSVSIVSALWRRDQVGGPVASKLDCHRDKNLLLGDFYHSQL